MPAPRRSAPIPTTQRRSSPVKGSVLAWPAVVVELLGVEGEPLLGDAVLAGEVVVRGLEDSLEGAVPLAGAGAAAGFGAGAVGTA